MGNALYFVVADIFVPFFLRVGQHVQAQAGLKPLYLSFLPRDNTWLKQQVPTVLPRDVYTLDDVVVRSDLIDREGALELLAFMRAKHGGTEAVWLNRLNKVASYIQWLFDTNDIRVVVMWNGEDFVGRVLTLFARRAGIKTLFFENGYFSQTLQCDAAGINAASSLVGKDFAQMKLELDQAKQEAATVEPEKPFLPLNKLSKLHLVMSSAKRNLDRGYYDRFPEQRGSSWLKRKRVEKARSRIPLDIVDLPSEFIFVPLQVHDDTQVLLNCRHFNTVEQFFEVAYAAIKRNFGEQAKVVVKEHPEDLCRYSYEDFRKKFPDVLWLKKFDVEKLLDLASCVVLINSSVGLQAVKRLKPVIVFGDSFYSRDEVAFCVHEMDQIDEVFSRAKKGVDPQMAAQIAFFVDYLQSVYFFKGTWKSVTSDATTTAAARVIALARGHIGEQG